MTIQVSQGRTAESGSEGARVVEDPSAEEPVHATGDALPPELAPLAARRELWKLLSAGLSDPYLPCLREVLSDDGARARAAAAARLVAGEAPGTEVDLGPGEISPALLRVAPVFDAYDRVSPPELEASYRGLFGHTAGSSCPAYAGAFEREENVFYRAQRMADVAGFYRAFGLEVDHRAGERVDHVAVLCDFLQHVLTMECRARAVSKQEQAEISADARRKLFQEHVGWWLPAFAALVRERSNQHPFYVAVADLAAALSAAERCALGLAPFETCAAPAPQAAPEPDGCAACPGLAGPATP